MSSFGSPGPDPVSVNKANNGLGCLVAFGALFAIIGFVLFGTQFVYPSYQVWSSQSWIPTPCQVTLASVNSHSGKSTTYSFDVAYKYTFGGRSFVGDRYSFGPANTSWTEANSRFSSFPPGSTATCFVDPSNPSNAVLFRGMTRGIWISLATLLFAAFGLLFAGIGVFSGRAAQAKRTDWRPKSAIPQDHPPSRVAPVPTPFESGPFSSLDNSPRATPSSQAVEPAPPTGSGPVLLKPKHSPAGKFWGGLFISLFWNGIVGVFLFQMVSGFLRGQASFMEWFLAVFLIPFELIGLGLIIFTVGQFLALFNAKAAVTCSRSTVTPGQALEVSWTFGGGAFYPTDVIVTLEGTEEATYRRGTDTVTDRSTFFFETLYDSTRESSNRHQASVTIPPGTMHSFEAPNNKIVWTLKVQGLIKRWPDISDEYPIIVAPAPPR